MLLAAGLFAGAGSVVADGPLGAFTGTSTSATGIGGLMGGMGMGGMGMGGMGMGMGGTAAGSHMDAGAAPAPGSAEAKAVGHMSGMHVGDLADEDEMPKECERMMEDPDHDMDECMEGHMGGMGGHMGGHMGGMHGSGDMSAMCELMLNNAELGDLVMELSHAEEPLSPDELREQLSAVGVPTEDQSKWIEHILEHYGPDESP